MTDLPAGPELDRLIAEKVMGWTWFQVPKHDYDGPLPEQGKVLVPPGFDPKGFEFPPKGVVGPGYFCGHFQPSTNITNAWQVVAHQRRFSFSLQAPGSHPGVGWRVSFGIHHGEGDTAQLAICRAALQSVSHQ